MVNISERKEQVAKRQNEDYAFAMEKLQGLEGWRITAAQAGGDEETIHRLDIDMLEMMLDQVDAKMNFTISDFTRQVDYLKTYVRNPAVIQALVIALDLDKTERIERIYSVVPNIDIADTNIWLLMDYLYPGNLRPGSAMMIAANTRQNLVETL